MRYTYFTSDKFALTIRVHFDLDYSDQIAAKGN